MILLTPILVGCLQISTIVAFDNLGEVKLTWMWRCPILRLPIGIIYGVKCGCEYTFGVLLLNWMDGWICQLHGPNWPLNSMPFNLFSTIIFFGIWSYDWFTNVLVTFCNSTCLAIPILMWKGIKGQSMIMCPSYSQNA